VIAANRLKVSPSTLQNWEQGHREPRGFAFQQLKKKSNKAHTSLTYGLSYFCELFHTSLSHFSNRVRIKLLIGKGSFQVYRAIE
jgi:hypothetical protein